MKYDFDLIHGLLERAADLSAGGPAGDVLHSRGTQSPDVHEHVELLLKHKLLEGEAALKRDGRHVVNGLTHEGRALLTAIRNPSVKEKLHVTAEKLGEDMTMHVVMDIANFFLTGPV